jgi:acetylornithine aminotransferase/acetylornithine/N-succinyldiaminopimelate aminotransferase
MLALELDSADLAKIVLGEMMNRHILINRTSETVLRFLPPYILRREHVDEGVGALDEILTEQTAQADSPITGGNKIGQ